VIFIISQKKKYVIRHTDHEFFKKNANPKFKRKQKGEMRTGGNYWIQITGYVLLSDCLKIIIFCNSYKILLN